MMRTAVCEGFADNIEGVVSTDPLCMQTLYAAIVFVCLTCSFEPFFLEVF